MSINVAFSAFPASTIDFDSGITVKYDSIVTNIGGFYNPETSIFTCPTDGIYLFSVSFYTYDNRLMTGNIVRDGTVLLQLYSDFEEDQQASTTVLTECLAFDSVWVECAEDNSELRSGRRSSFSGVLITEYV